MKLSLFSDNTLKVLMYVATHTEQRCTRSAISDYFDLSNEHLRKVIHQLSQWGYLNTFSGRNGGIEIAMPLDKINIAEIIKKTEKQMTMFDCTTLECRLMPSCSLNKALWKAQQAFFKELENYTLASLLQDKKTLRLLNQV